MGHEHSLSEQTEKKNEYKFKNNLAISESGVHYKLLD